MFIYFLFALIFNSDIQIMYKYNENEKNLLINRILILKKQLIFFFSGIINENEFKSFRLQNGLYRQKKSYMYRLLIPYGFLSFKQIYLISYLINKFDKNYIHLTTRTNIQLNWIKILDYIHIYIYLFFLNLNSIQTSGNCIRNITLNYNFYNNNYFENKLWSEIIKQLFNLNSEFLFLPRKFKISISNFRNDNNYLKIHDLGIFLKKNSLNNILFDIFIGGGLGRSPLLGFNILKNIHWKKIFIFCDKIIRIYNINGYRDNIYKSRIKILLKSISINKFNNFIKNEYFYSNIFIHILNEDEINKIINNFYLYNFKNRNFIKKIEYNIFFIDWINIDFYFEFKKKINIVLLLKYYNLPPGDINFIQLKILFYISLKYSNIYYFYITNRQNIIFSTNYLNLYNIYNILKKYFFLIYNYNSFLDIVSCPGKDFCSLGNSESISLSLKIQKYFINYNSLKKFEFFNLNISGCINSCSHHHISNFGFLGVNKKGENWYQLLIGGDNSFNNLIFSKILGPSKSKYDTLKIFIKIIKNYLNFKNNNKYFIDIYNKLNFNFFKKIFLTLND